MDDLPIISVVIPAHNEEQYVEAALQSVLDQVYPHELLECVVAENASYDTTVQVVERWAAAHPQLPVKVTRHAEPGVGQAKNEGAAAARGAILVFLDADSRMQPGLARAVAESDHAGCPAGSIKIVADSRHPLDRGFFALMEIGKVWFGVRSQMMYCRRDLFLALGGFDPALQLAEDLEFLARVQARVRQRGLGHVPHLTTSAIATSPRRLRRHPLHLAMFPMFARWLLAFAGVGRTKKY